MGLQKKYSIKLSRLVEHFELQILHKSSDYDMVEICTADLFRPGLPLAGFYEHFAAERIQILGKVESSYVERLEPDARRASFTRLFSTGIPALVICHKSEVLPECLEAAAAQNVSVFSTDRDTTDFVAACIGWLKVELAPRITRHGVLVEVYGEGLYLTGESGVGKSEAAIELIKRGHRLIADDAVEIRRTSDTVLIGTAPESIRYYMELRGLGIIDVRRLFGIGAVKQTEQIDLVIHVEEWRDDVVYDRLGIDLTYTEMLGIQVPSITMPIKPGRNLAVMIEVAAMNNRQRKMGYHAALEFTQQLDQFFAEDMD
ncbi:MAG: HPr(Ser) kinase/phosphatase [Oscillospiraceae bacterium]|nr:HPr(Ser) kinase/phosphatase [Oscillospiraceae bacterium]